MSSAEFTPYIMTEVLAAQLSADGYFLPESWPFPARVAPEMNSAAGWQVQTYGHGREEGRVVYIAPDGSKFCRATHGARAVLVGLSKRTSAVLLRVLPGTRRPAWVIADLPKSEVPEQLRRYLLQKGERLAKGQPRQARQLEALLIEPEQASGKGSRGRYGSGERGRAAAQIGPRPRTGAKSPELREWERRFRQWQKEQAGYQGAARPAPFDPSRARPRRAAVVQRNMARRQAGR